MVKKFHATAAHRANILQYPQVGETWNVTLRLACTQGSCPLRTEKDRKRKQKPQRNFNTHVERQQHDA